MNDLHRFSAFALSQRRRHSKRLYMAALVALLIAALIYETTWLNLRSGLFILLGGQAGDVLFLFVRNIQIAQDAKMSDVDQASYLKWFDAEERFLRRLALFDATCHMLGFFSIGYVFWLSTQNLALALAIGLLYPVTLYLGMTRRKNLEAIRQLTAERGHYV